MKPPGLLVFAFAVISSLSAKQQVLPDLPEVRGPFTLSAVYDFAVGHNGSTLWQTAFGVNGNVVRESTGETSKKKAEDKLKTRLVEVQTGTFCGPQFKRTLVAELAEDMFRDYRINMRKSLDDVDAR